MEPLYFGPGGRELFGVRHEPRGTPRRTGIVLCPGWGMEYMRAYKGLALLARQLAERGFETLRFDYGGTGDSAGDAGDATLDRWTADIHTAARELLELSGCERICVFGLRLGALLALHASTRGLRADSLALWDLPESGRHWLDSARTVEGNYYRGKNRYRARGNQLVSSDDEIVGMPMPPALAAEIHALQPVPPAGVRAACEVLSADQRAVLGPDVPALALPEASNWGDHNWLTTPWVPNLSARAVVDHFAAWLP